MKKRQQEQLTLVNREMQGFGAATFESLLQLQKAFDLPEHTPTWFDIERIRPLLFCFCSAATTLWFNFGRGTLFYEGPGPR
jgi:hypothetical protein